MNENCNYVENIFAKGLLKLVMILSAKIGFLDSFFNNHSEHFPSHHAATINSLWIHIIFFLPQWRARYSEFSKMASSAGA